MLRYPNKLAYHAPNAYSLSLLSDVLLDSIDVLEFIVLFLLNSSPLARLSTDLGHVLH